ncbi:DNA ligase D [Granulicella sp. WH15]|uniref:DNA ligase D n=1 Tax=Granulicella sp. WH15 TaxID=2602070 RepID=UPI001366ACFB|nr:DNA ligase D [Granulicella sp. WH15]QHN04108.1 DNA ligase D [Granulicella sp. WH15]
MKTHRKQAPSDAVEEQLERYRSMRDFSITSEPSGRQKGAAPKQGQFPFVVQKHSATRLHYDFRLGWNGVLKSWAVAKGPSYVPSERRLAVEVEDHPMAYGGFEGIIPKGQYGGGTVMIWDQGTWEPQAGHTDVAEGLRKGSLKFVMHGKKMRGKWALVRMEGKAGGERKPNWLLIKEHDEFEKTADDEPITEEMPNSVVTGRSLEQIAEHEDHVWDSSKTADGNAWYRQEPTNSNGAKKKRAASPLPSLAKIPDEKLPGFMEPQLASSTATPPRGPGWLHELKLDGYRIQARKEGKKVQLLTRNGLDWTHRMKTIAEQIAALPVELAILDGEVVVLSEDGTTSFANLQASFQEGVKHPLTYFVFDLLHLNGHNLRPRPLKERKELLLSIVQDAGEFIRFSEHLEADGMELFHHACELHAEGIVSKSASSAYVSGRSSSWLKSKCIHEQEFVIGGYTLLSNGGLGVGALLLGYYRDGALIYAGRTGTGFTQKTHQALRSQLDERKQEKSPFHGQLPADARRGAIWVKPELVAQVTFATWTADNLVRQAAFQGIREDKPAIEVRKEDSAVSKPRATKPTKSKTPASFPAPVETALSKKNVPPVSPITFTNPDKILDAETNLTKSKLAEYYWEIAPFILPHIANRPLSLVRCPDGTGHNCFFQKHGNKTVSAAVDTVSVPDKKTGKPEAYITLSTREAVAELAQMGVLEVHPWGSCNEDLEHPDRIIFDLDPDIAISWQTLASTALEIRKQLKTLGLVSFLKTTGGKGLHVVVPIQPTREWMDVKEFSHQFVLAMEQQNPDLYLTKMSKAARKNKIYLDYLRNERGATAVAPFSPRARSGMNVSLPLDWSELKQDEYPVCRVADFGKWRKRLKSDPWKDFFQAQQELSFTVARQ